MTVADGHQWLVGIGEGGVHQVAHIALIVALCPFVDVVKGKEQLLLARFGINGVTLLHIRLYQLVAPPCEPHVLGLHGVEVGTAEVQVFQCEELVLCHDR